MNSPVSCIAPDVVFGQGVRIASFVNLYGCVLGDDSFVGPYVEIQRGVVVGRRVKIQSHAFLCSGVTVEDEAFIGHGVMFTNDVFPRSTNPDSSLKSAADWQELHTRVGRRASIGSNATILCGITIGENAMIGAGSVVTKDVPPGAVVAGNPARVLRYLIEKP